MEIITANGAVQTEIKRRLPAAAGRGCIQDQKVAEVFRL
jgi:hypothetical protein